MKNEECHAYKKRDNCPKKLDTPHLTSERGSLMANRSERAFLCEVGPRDGFQMETTFIPTDLKVEVVNALARTGIPAIQVTSFVHPRAVPQMRDAEEVAARIERLPGVRYSALVPNPRGAERALAAGFRHIDVVVSATDSHSLSNTRMTTAEAMARLGETVRLVKEAGAEVMAGFATALGCPFEGFPSYDRIEALCAQAIEEYGVEKVNIADTVGMANPRLVRDTLSGLIRRFPGVTFSVHLHDTRGMGLANLLQALEVGVRHFDASIAGLGGCPFAPGATGNISSEDAVHMLEEMGVDTGIDLGPLIEVGRRVAAAVGHADSKILKAGTSRKPA